MSLGTMTSHSEIRCLEADPPWQFGDRLPGKGRGAEKHYRVLTLEEIKAFPLPALAPDCVLLLWRVAAMQEEALSVVRAWGFTVKTEIVWAKRTKHGKRWFGMGHYLRAEHEICLVATRGKVKPLNRGTRSIFEGKVRKHSQKPAEFYELAESLFPGPRARLFARDEREGWESYGDEV